MPLTTVLTPGKPLWQCCKAAPARVIQYDNGGASVTCKSCAASYARVNGPGWVFSLPEGYAAPDHLELARRLAESAREYHFAVCGLEDVELSGDQGETYRRSAALFKAAIANAYPELGYAEIYDVWLDCNETVEWCANVVRADRARQMADSL